MGFGGVVVLGAVQCGQYMEAEAPVRSRAALVSAKTGKQQSGGTGSSMTPDMVAGRDVRQAKQGLVVGAPLSGLAAPLVRWKKGALGEEHRKGCQADINYGVAVKRPCVCRAAPCCSAARSSAGCRGRPWRGEARECRPAQPPARESVTTAQFAPSPIAPPYQAGDSALSP